MLYTDGMILEFKNKKSPLDNSYRYAKILSAMPTV